MKIASQAGIPSSRVLVVWAAVSFALISPTFSQTQDSFTFPLDGAVYAMAVQPDGKVVVGGQMTAVNGVARAHIARLHRDGALDETFNPGANGAVYGVAVQPDGRLLVAGAFTTLGATNRSHLGRLNPDGSVDTLFNPGADGDVLALAVQADGKIIVGGNFSTLASVPRSRIGRLNSDGSLDMAFNLRWRAALFAPSPCSRMAGFLWAGNSVTSTGSARATFAG